MARHAHAVRESAAGLTAPPWLADDMVGRAITLAVYLAVEASCDARVVDALVAAKTALIEGQIARGWTAADAVRAAEALAMSPEVDA